MLAFFISILLASIAVEIMFLMIFFAFLLVSILFPNISTVNQILFIIGSIFVLFSVIFSWILIFKKSYKYFDENLELEIKRLNKKESIIFVLLLIFVLLTAVILIEWLDKLAK